MSEQIQEKTTAEEIKQISADGLIEPLSEFPAVTQSLLAENKIAIFRLHAP